jgi:hypothetical protein
MWYCATAIPPIVSKTKYFSYCIMLATQLSEMPNTVLVDPKSIAAQKIRQHGLMMPTRPSQAKILSDRVMRPPWVILANSFFSYHLSIEVDLC